MEKKNYCVYIHRSPSNKAYIGITSTTPDKRWDNGRGYFKKTKNGNYHQPAIVNAIKKYGWDNFEHIIFAENLSKEQAEKVERLLIALWKTNDKRFGYNIRNGGGSIGALTEETRAKMREAHKGHLHTEEEKRKISEANSGENHWLYGKHHTEETRKKMSESQKKRGYNKENLKKAVDACKRTICCVELCNQFESITEASRQLGVPRTTINDALSGRLTHAGKHPVTGEDLHWKYVE